MSMIAGKSGSDIARDEGVTRQSVSESLRDPEARHIVKAIWEARERFSKWAWRRYLVLYGWDRRERQRNWETYRRLMDAWDSKRLPALLRRYGVDPVDPDKSVQNHTVRV